MPTKLWEVTNTTPKPWCTLWSALQFLELTHQARVPLQTTFVSTHESFPANRSPAYATSIANFSLSPKRLPNQPYVFLTQRILQEIAKRVYG